MDEETVRPLSVIGAPSSAGAYGPGQERAPAVFRAHGLLDRLAAAGREVVDWGDGRQVRWRPDETRPEAANAGSAANVASELADNVAAAIARGHDVLVLGGDCTVELGTVIGAQRDGASVALAYIDMDADLHTPATAEGFLDWMGVAHLLGIEGTTDELASLGRRRPILQPDAVRLLAAGNITPPEQATIDRLGVHVETLQTVVAAPADVLSRTSSWAQAYDRLLVHVDIDVLDNDQFPIAENQDRRGGLQLAQLAALVVELCSHPNFRALTVCEVNPDHAPDEQRSFKQLVDMIVSALRAAPVS